MRTEKTAPRHAPDPLAINTFRPFVTKAQRFSAAWTRFCTEQGRSEGQPGPDSLWAPGAKTAGFIGKCLSFYLLAPKFVLADRDFGLVGGARGSCVVTFSSCA